MAPLVAHWSSAAALAPECASANFVPSLKTEQLSSPDAGTAARRKRHLPAEILAAENKRAQLLPAGKQAVGGTTDSEIQAYFNSGSQAAPPFAKAGPSGGNDVVSPWNLIRVSFPPSCPSCPAGGAHHMGELG